MKVVVIGKGLAAMGLIEALLKDRDESLEIDWIGPSFEDTGWENCSRNSTAVVALHGIQRGLSPLGDDLVSAYEKANQFINNLKPEGVRVLRRYHICDSPDSKTYSKLERRFGEVRRIEVFGEKLFGYEEDAYVFTPLTFMDWWANRLTRDKRINCCDDYIVSIQDEKNQSKAIGLKDSYSFESLFDCRGSSNECVEKIPGQYAKFPMNDLNRDCVLTYAGHNLILDKERRCAILGGSTEQNEISAPSVLELCEQAESFEKHLPELKEIFNFDNAELYSGIRPKGKRRRPIVRKNSQGHILINGLYKNGYSLCHLLGEKALALT